MITRLYTAQDLSVGETINLSPEKSHRLINVLRIRKNQQIACFDGLGNEFEGIISDISRKNCKLVIGDQTQKEVPRLAPLHLGMAWLKGSSMDLVVQKATELGVSDFWPILATRCNVRINPKRTANKLDHWQKIAIHAAEQSQQLFVPKIHGPVELEEFISEHKEIYTIFLHQTGALITPDLQYQSLSIIVGPEGGWSEQEVSLAKTLGANINGLGQRILRAETAPLAVIASVHQMWGGRSELTSNL